MQIDSLTLEPGDRVVPGPAPAPITVVLADRHVTLRRSMRRLLDHEGGVTVLSEAADLPETLHQLSIFEPAVLLLGLHMPGGSSIAALSRVRELVPGASTVILAMTDDCAMARRALDAGAAGYVLKHDAAEDLPPAIWAAAHGRRFLSPRVFSRVSGGRGGFRRPAREGLRQLLA
jgi:DNA-binding NarL/FixJ family response regulator